MVKNLSSYFIWAVLFVGFLSSVSAQSITGSWKTVDDTSGKPRSVIQIYQKGDLYYGEVISIFSEPGEDPDPICDLCTDSRKNQKIIGMEIISNLRFNPDEGEYQDGEILDPENGNIYQCKIWLDENGNLKVRGYLYFFFRTQTWLPFDE